MRKNKQKIISILIFAIVFNLALVGLYTIVLNTIKKKSENTSTVSVELEGYLNKEGKVNTVKNAVESTKDHRVKLEKYFINIDGIPVFTQKIESLKEISGVDEITINGLKQKNNTLLLDFKTVGGFEDVLYLVQLVENLPFKVNIKKSYITKIKSAENVEEKIKWNGLFSIEIIGFLDNQ